MWSNGFCRIAKQLQPSRASWAPTTRFQGGALYQDWRGVARVRLNRFTGVKAVKVGPKKTAWQLAAEKEFLLMRSRHPTQGYKWRLTPDDVRNLSPGMQECLSLHSASSTEISKYRKQELIKKFQRRPFDTNSHAVRIATLTEKILNLRAYLLRHPTDRPAKRVMDSASLRGKSQ